MTRLTLAALALPVLMLAACTTLTPTQRAAVCRSTNWETYGYNDGVLGVPLSERVDKFADCAKLGAPVDRRAYDTGRARGLREYCTVRNGYQVGYSGRPYRDVCPPGLAPSFLQGFKQGRADRPVRGSFYFGIGTGYWHDPWHRW